MADVKLGPSGSETTLPNPKWITGDKPSLQTDTEKQILEETMTDGTIRYAMFRKYGIIPLQWGFLTLAQLNTLKGLHALNQTLRYQDNNEDATWYNVIIMTFNHAPADTAIRSMGRYKCSMTLREV